jgi:hypothetical protein
MKTLKIFILVSLLILLSPAKSNAQGKTLYDVDYWTFVIPCTNEFVWGTVIEEYIPARDMRVHLIYNGELTCFATGNVYDFHENIVHPEWTLPKPGETISSVHNFTLKSKTGAKYTIHARVHITCDSDGTITTSHDFENIKCF